MAFPFASYSTTPSFPGPQHLNSGPLPVSPVSGRSGPLEQAGGFDQLAHSQSRRSGAVRKRRREVTTQRGNWTPDEDATLRRLVEDKGPKHWREIAAAIPGRTGKQARERWINQLSPTVKKGGGWTEEEDRQVVFLQGTIGNRWSFISKYLKGRTDNHVKNRYNSTLKRKAENGFYDLWLASIGYERGNRSAPSQEPSLVHHPEPSYHQFREYESNAPRVPSPPLSQASLPSIGEPLPATQVPPPAYPPNATTAATMSYTSHPPSPQPLSKPASNYHHSGAETSSRRSVMSVSSLLS